MIPMKKIYIMLAAYALAVCALTSCVNPSVEEYGAINVTAKLSTIVSGFKLYDSTNLDLPENTTVQVRCLVYGSDGNRCSEDTQSLSGFDGMEQSFSFKAKIGESYTVVLFASCINGSNRAFDYSGLESINSIKITQNNISAHGYSVLGYGVRTIHAGENIVVNMEPLTSLLYIRFESIHAHDNDVDAVDQYVVWSHINTTAEFNGNNFNFSTVLGQGDYITNKLSPSSYEAKTNNVYSVNNFLPGNIPVIGLSYIGNDISKETIEQSVNIVSGHQYVLNLDCKQLTLTFREGSL